MGKASKVRIKAAGKGAKRWKKGQSSSSNPVIKKHRDLARGRFFGPIGGKSSLTSEALELFNAGGSAKPCSTSEDKAECGTVNTWATNWTDCTNATFSRVQRYWASNNAMHKEVLAALAAVAEVIKAQGGQETDTEYFAALMTALETVTEIDSLAAIVYLLSLVMKRVPVSVLKARFAEISKTLVDVLKKHAESGSPALIKGLLSCIASLLRVQELHVWGDASTVHVFSGLLSFAMHPKPKVRKALKDCIVMVVRNTSTAASAVGTNKCCHPSAVLTAKYCMQQLESFAGGEPADVIHLLNLIKEVIAFFPESGLKSSCETMLRLMTLSNVMVTGVCLDVLMTMFKMKPLEISLSAELNAKIITAMYDFVPNVNDVQLMPSWLGVMEGAHANLARLDAKLSIGHLPKLVTNALSCLLSERRENAVAAKLAMQSAITACFGGLGDELTTYVKSCDGSSPIHRIIRLLESGLGYQYHASWDLHLHVVATAFEVLGKQCANLFQKCLTLMGSLRESHRFPYMAELDHAIGVAVTAMGPKTVVEAIPLQALAGSDIKETVISHSWLLPILSKSICNTELAYFAGFVLPLAARFKDKAAECMSKQQVAQQKVYETLVHQLWSLLPGFCTRPTDVPKAFSSIAKVLGTVLKDRADLRATVLTALRKLITTSQDDDDGSRKEISKYGKNFIPVLLNLYTAAPEPGHEKDTARLAVLETVKIYLPIIDPQLFHSLFDNCLEKLREEGIDTFKRNAVLDVAVAMVKHANDDELSEVFELVKPQLQATDKSVQKKAYRFLEEMLSADAAPCQQFVLGRLAELQELLVKSQSTASSPAKAPRLRCLASLFRRLCTRQQDLLSSVVPEAILCTREVAEHAREAAYRLLLEIGTSLERWTAAEVVARVSDSGEEPVDANRIRSEVASEYFQLVMAGLAGSVNMMHCTLLAMTRLLIEYRRSVSASLLVQLLDGCCVLLRSKSREIVLPALGFLKVVVGSFDSAELSQHLENVISSLVEMKDENKHHLRFKTKELYARLIRKFGYEIIHKMVPVSHHKILQNIRKTQERTKRKKALSRAAAAEDDEVNELLLPIPQASQPPETFDDLLQDSDSEFGQEGASVGKGASSRRRGATAQRQAWLRDSDDRVTDFLDAGMAKNLTASKPVRTSGSQAAESKKGVFKTAPDGRLIITEHDEEETRSNSQAQKNLKRKRGRGGDVSLDLDNLMTEIDARDSKTKKRKVDSMDDDGGMSESASVATFSTYQPGGRGIHRKLPGSGGGSSGEAKDSRKGWKTGDEYKAKKAGGDMKRKGMPDPYAYVPLSAQTLNKRKQAKLKGQFKGLVGAARKGAQKGSKAVASKKGKLSNKRHRR